MREALDRDGPEVRLLEVSVRPVVGAMGVIWLQEWSPCATVGVLVTAAGAVKAVQGAAAGAVTAVQGTAVGQLGTRSW